MPLWLAVLIALMLPGGDCGHRTGDAPEDRYNPKQLVEINDPQAIVKQATADVLPAGGYRTLLNGEKSVKTSRGRGDRQS